MALMLLDPHSMVDSREGVDESSKFDAFFQFLSDDSDSVDSNALWVIENGDFRYGGPVYVGGEEPIPKFKLRHVNSGRYLHLTNEFRLKLAAVGILGKNKMRKALKRATSRRMSNSRVSIGEPAPAMASIVQATITGTGANTVNSVFDGTSTMTEITFHPRSESKSSGGIERAHLGLNQAIFAFVG